MAGRYDIYSYYCDNQNPNYTFHFKRGYYHYCKVLSHYQNQFFFFYCVYL